MSLIRREVAGQTAYDFTMPFSRFDSEENAKIRRHRKDCHFNAHMQWAFDALCLHWYEVNRNKCP